jgi:hypothetical protein
VKFLIDECLSLDLVEVAQGRGFGESSHVVWMGRAGWKDWQLKPFILEGDWTFVTRNSVDFRGSADSPGYSGQFADVPLHAGLVCINGPNGMTADYRSAHNVALRLAKGEASTEELRTAMIQYRSLFDDLAQVQTPGEIRVA